jgi:lysophospholipase-3
LGESIDALRKLVEDTYHLNNNTKVALLGHSMGNPYALYMLNHQSQEWKDKYVKALITLAGPWGGAVKVLRLYASGKY